MFIPDQRNLGGRQIICNMIWNHRLSLNVLDEKSVNSPIQTKLHTPRQGCQTERQQNKPSLFFRRLPSNKKQYTELLYQKPLSFPKKNIIPQTPKQIDWESLKLEIKSLKLSTISQNIKRLATRYNIKTEFDFASLIENILDIFPRLVLQDLIEICSDIIVQ
ncbi:hypothetical protein pb186bvf_010794 [Paramecium bursaria]